MAVVFSCIPFTLFLSTGTTDGTFQQSGELDSFLPTHTEEIS